MLVSVGYERNREPREAEAVVVVVVVVGEAQEAGESGTPDRGWGWRRADQVPTNWESEGNRGSRLPSTVDGFSACASLSHTFLLPTRTQTRASATPIPYPHPNPRLTCARTARLPAHVSCLISLRSSNLRPRISAPSFSLSVAYLPKVRRAYSYVRFIESTNA